MIYGFENGDTRVVHCIENLFGNFTAKFLIKTNLFPCTFRAKRLCFLINRENYFFKTTRPMPDACYPFQKKTE